MKIRLLQCYVIFWIIILTRSVLEESLKMECTDSPKKLPNFKKKNRKSLIFCISNSGKLHCTYFNSSVTFISKVQIDNYNLTSKMISKKCDSYFEKVSLWNVQTPQKRSTDAFIKYKRPTESWLEALANGRTCL